MRVSTQHRKARTKETTRVLRAHSENKADLMQPEELRERVQTALAAATEDQRAAFRDQVFRVCRTFGIDAAACLLLIGISARTVDELSTSDIAKLVRYLRLNFPVPSAALAKPLSELLRGGPRHSPAGTASKKAA